VNQLVERVDCLGVSVLICKRGDIFGEPHRILAVRAVIDLDFIVDSGSGEGQLRNGSRTNQARYAPSVPHGIGDVLSTFMRSETTTRTCVPVLVFA
jgi:hypothetical protein